MALLHGRGHGSLATMRPCIAISRISHRFSAGLHTRGYVLMALLHDWPCIAMISGSLRYAAGLLMGGGELPGGFGSPVVMGPCIAMRVHTVFLLCEVGGTRTLVLHAAPHTWSFCLNTVWGTVSMGKEAGLISHGFSPIYTLRTGGWGFGGRFSPLGLLLSGRRRR